MFSCFVEILLFTMSRIMTMLNCIPGQSRLDASKTFLRALLALFVPLIKIKTQDFFLAFNIKSDKFSHDLLTYIKVSLPDRDHYK